jgi:hypothetical protein
VNKFAEGLDGAINRCRHFPQLQTRLKGRGWHIASAFFVGYSNEVPFFYRAEFYHLSGIVAEYEITKFSGAILSGSDVVRKLMYNDDGTAVPDSPFSQYIPSARSNSLDDATAYANGYIEACCTPLARELDPKIGKMTGGHIHIAELTREDGFRWRVPPKA